MGTESDQAMLDTYAAEIATQTARAEAAEARLRESEAAREKAETERGMALVSLRDSEVGAVYEELKILAGRLRESEDARAQWERRYDLELGRATKAEGEAFKAKLVRPRGGAGRVRSRRDGVRHKAAPIHVDDWTLRCRCRYCNRPIQWRWLLLRWRHVD